MGILLSEDSFRSPSTYSLILSSSILLNSVRSSFPVDKTRISVVRLNHFKGKVKDEVWVQAIRAERISGFCSMKRLGVFLLPPRWDASPSQVYPPALNLPVPIYIPGWREAL